MENQTIDPKTQKLDTLTTYLYKNLSNEERIQARYLLSIIDYTYQDLSIKELRDAINKR